MAILRLALLILSCVPWIGCSDLWKAPAPTQSLAQEAFVKICKEEFHYPVVVKTVGHTVWIYLPIEEDIFSLKANDEKPSESSQKKRAFSVEYLDGHFDDRTFRLEYDILPVTKPMKGYGYQNAASEKYSRKKNNILTAISRTYFDLGEEPGGPDSLNAEHETGRQDVNKAHAGGEKPPDFFVIVITDIVNGIETEEIFYLKDFKRYMSQEMPHEEYSKRYLSEIKGDKSAIGDRAGNHLDYKEVTWPEFLIKQIIRRISFKYQTSDFQPTENTEMEIVRIVGEAVKAYSFEDFTAVQLHNLRKDETYLFDKSQL